MEMTLFCRLEGKIVSLVRSRFSHLSRPETSSFDIGGWRKEDPPLLASLLIYPYLPIPVLLFLHSAAKILICDDQIKLARISSRQHCRLPVVYFLKLKGGVVETEAELKGAQVDTILN
jgi:hypothetical protein